MANEQAFLKAIAENPDDATNRLVFADWLEDHDDPRSRIARDVACIRIAMRAWVEAPIAYERQSAYWLRLHTQYPDLVPSDPPSVEKVLRTFSPEQWEAIERLRNPKLILVPPMEFAAHLTLLNEHANTSSEYHTEVDRLYINHASAPSVHWRAFFVEGDQHCDAREELFTNSAAEPEDWPTLHSYIAAEIAERCALSPCIQGMDRFLYACLMLEGLEHNAPVDSMSKSTVLDGDAAWLKGDHILVPTACFSVMGPRVEFRSTAAIDNSTWNFPIRRAVGGEVK